MQTKEAFVYDLYLSQNLMSVSLRVKLRTFQGASVLKGSIVKEIMLKLKLIKIDVLKNMFELSQVYLFFQVENNLIAYFSGIFLLKYNNFLGICHYVCTSAYYLYV